MIKTAGVEGVEYELLWKSEANVTRDDSDIVQAIKKNAEAIWALLYIRHGSGLAATQENTVSRAYQPSSMAHPTQKASMHQTKM